MSLLHKSRFAPMVANVKCCRIAWNKNDKNCKIKKLQNIIGKNHGMKNEKITEYNVDSF